MDDKRVQSLRLDTRPLYARTVDALLDLIEGGTYGAGDVLPSEESLARQLGVSRSTVREAIMQLEKDGLITRRHGVGTFVAERSQAHFFGGLERLRSYRSLAQAAGIQVEIVHREVTDLPAGPEWADLVDVPAGAPLVRVQVIEAIDGCRTAYLDGFVARDLVDLDAVRDDRGSLLDYLVDETDLPLAYTHSEVRAVNADAELAQRLALEVGRALLRLDETVYAEARRPLAHFQNYFLTDCFNFTIFRQVVRNRRRGTT